MAFETALAKVSRKLEDLRDPERSYNKMTLADIQRKDTPSIDWNMKTASWNLLSGILCRVRCETGSADVVTGFRSRSHLVRRKRVQP